VRAAVRGLLLARLFAPRTAFGLLQSWRLTLRDGLQIALHADTLRPWYRMQIALHSVPSSAPFLDCSRLDTWRFLPLSDISDCVSARPAVIVDASTFIALSFVSRP